MAMQDLLESLRGFDTAQLNDFNNVGSWPLAVKILIWIVAFAIALVGGYFGLITGLQQDLAKAQKEEVSLRADYRTKYAQAAHLDAYKKQQQEMKESFDAILRQLPSDTEIPGLIEDITLVGLKNGLSFSSIDLQPEQTHEFYIEKPIKIVVTGTYHDLGAFVSDVADLSRIVTLHDFSIAPSAANTKKSAAPGEDQGEGLLKMTIEAKTYRYKAQS